MLADDVLLQRSNTGEIRLYDSRDQFCACFKNGQWFDHLIFDAYTLEKFDLIEDDNEIMDALSNARTTLSRRKISNTKRNR